MGFSRPHPRASLGRLAGIWEVERGRLNPIHVSAMLTRLAKMSPSGHGSGGAGVGARGGAVPGPRERLLCRHLAGVVAADFPAFPPRNLASVLSALAKLRHAPGDRWAAGWAAAFARRLPEATSRDIAGALWALAALGQRLRPDFLDALLAAAASRAASCGADVANIAWALGSMRAAPATAPLARLLATAVHMAPVLSPAELSALAWGAARTRAPLPRALAPALADATARQWLSLSPRQVATLGWSLARMRHRPADAWLLAFLAASSRMMPHSAPADCCQAASALAGLLRARPGPGDDAAAPAAALSPALAAALAAWAAAFFAHTGPRLRTFGAQELISTASAVSWLPAEQRALAAAGSARSAAATRPAASMDADAADAADAARNGGGAVWQQQTEEDDEDGLPPPRTATLRPPAAWRDALHDAAAAQLSDCTPRALAELLAALGRLRSPVPPWLRDAALAEARGALGRGCDAATAAKLAAALDTLRWRPGREWWQAWLRSAAAWCETVGPSAWSPDRVRLLWAASRLPRAPPAAWLAAALDGAPAALPGLPTPALAQLLRAAARLQCRAVGPGAGSSGASAPAVLALLSASAEEAGRRDAAEGAVLRGALTDARRQLLAPRGGAGGLRRGSGLRAGLRELRAARLSAAAGDSSGEDSGSGGGSGSDGEGPGPPPLVLAQQPAAAAAAASLAAPARPAWPPARSQAAPPLQRAAFDAGTEG